MKDIPRAARSFILFAILVGALLSALHLRYLNWLNPGLWGLAVLAAAAQVLKVEGPTKRSSYNISWVVFGFTLVQLGAPEALVTMVAAHLVEWFWHRYTWYIQPFNISNYVLAISAAELINRTFKHLQLPYNAGPTLGILGGMAVFTLLNHLLIGVVLRLARGESIVKSGVFDPLGLMMDFTMLCLGGAASMLMGLSAISVILVMIPIYLLYSTLKVPALQRQTEIDPKTGLYNARYFAEMLENELSRANRYDRPLTVVLGDLDLLRNINNTYGHLAGDVVLIGIANILKERFRDYDVVARFGGEEFAILMPETTPEQAYPRIEQVRQVIEDTEYDITTSIMPIKATVSFGIATRVDFGQTANEIVHNADVALYNAKLSGRNLTVVHSTTDAESLFTPLPTHESIPAETLPLEDRIGQHHAPFQTNPLREPKQVKAELEAPQPSTPSTSINYPSWLTNAYIVAVGVGALSLTVFLLRSAGPPDWLSLATFALIVLLTEGLAIDIYVRNTSVSTSAAPLIAGAVLFGPIGALVLSLILATTALVKHRSRFSRFFFNISNHIISSSFAYALATIAGPSIKSQPPYIQFCLVVLAAIAVYMSSTGLVSGAIAFSMGQRINIVWRERFQWLWPYYFAMGVVGYAFILSYFSAGLLGVMAILVPMLMVRFSQTQYIDHTKGMVTQLRETNVELERHAEEISTLNEELLLAFSQVVDLRDPFVLGHSQHVSNYAVLIAQELGLAAERVELVRKAGLLHDVGKLGIPEAILLKPSRLTNEEYNMVKQHSSIGGEIVGTCHSLRMLVPFIRHHHERYDGKGYPDGLSERDIPLEARILAIADAVEAMASDRPYRRGLTSEEILEEVRKNAGTQFDPMVADAFLRIVENQEGVIVNSAKKVEVADIQRIIAQSYIHPATTGGAK